MESVKIYTTPTCHYCILAKEFLENNNVSFEDIDLTTHPEKIRELKEKSGQLGTPVLEIGDQIIIGFDKEEISRALNL